MSSVLVQRLVKAWKFGFNTAPRRRGSPHPKQNEPRGVYVPHKQLATISSARVYANAAMRVPCTYGKPDRSKYLYSTYMGPKVRTWELR